MYIYAISKKEKKKKYVYICQCDNWLGLFSIMTSQDVSLFLMFLFEVLIIANIYILDHNYLSSCYKQWEESLIHMKLIASLDRRGVEGSRVEGGRVS